VSPTTAIELEAPGLGKLDPLVVIAADDQLMRRRISGALAEAGLAVVAEGLLPDQRNNGGPASVVTVACDVSRADRMSELRRLRKRLRSASIIVVSPGDSGLAVRRALDAGADGFVLESELERALAATVRAVASGQTVVPRNLRRCVHRPAFSHRERQVLAMLASGLTNSQIADRLYLSESTVKSHLSTLFSKLGVRSRKEAAALALDPDEDLGADLLTAGVFPAHTDGPTRGTP
jgi:DNA-binding NarL/FixJ family response regulator